MLVVVVGHYLEFRLPHRNPYFATLDKLGVLLFFVLSGFLITGLLHRERAATAKLSSSPRGRCNCAVPAEGFAPSSVGRPSGMDHVHRGLYAAGVPFCAGIARGGAVGSSSVVQQRIPGRIFRSRTLRCCGAISYSVYLWQQLFLVTWCRDVSLFRKANSWVKGTVCGPIRCVEEAELYQSCEST